MTGVATLIGRDTRGEKLLVVGSQLLNVLIFDGEPDETISGRAWREGYIGGDPVWARRRKLIDWGFLRLRNDTDHCKNSHAKDIRFAELIVPEKRECRRCQSWPNYIDC